MFAYMKHTLQLSPKVQGKRFSTTAISNDVLL